MEKVVKINKKHKKHTKENLQQLSKEELIEKIIQIEAHNIQLKNIIQKLNADTDDNKGDEKSTKRRNFDFSKCTKRHILLRFFYLGWNYSGYAAQEDTNSTIEYYIFKALTRVCLIESRESSNYHRCGRTDKGVSSFYQVISIDIRSKFPIEQQFCEEGIKNELDYCQMLNRVLPEVIRCVSWAPITVPNYSARFDCYLRTYRYFFPRGNLNINAMRTAAKYLVGTHDFRNLCKMDVGNGVVTFIRRIQEADIVLSQKDQSNPEYDVFYFEFIGRAYLWHQVRCIVGVLLLIGQGNEEPSVIKDLLNVEGNPCKPQYSLAHDVPLNLYDCKFNSRSSFSYDSNSYKEEEQNENCEDESNKEVQLHDWVYNEESLGRVISDLQSQWTLSTTKTSMMREMLNSLNEIYVEKFPNSSKIDNNANVLLQGVKSKDYQKLMSRKKCESLENRIEHFSKKRRIQVNDNCTEDKQINP
uniref:Putative pseudouridylate synthase n=1 Tax=Corethrella appendiculata TaxID=1370023 RepID=U5EYI7_9DIPT